MTETESFSVEQQIVTVCGLLKEFTAKLVALRDREERAKRIADRVELADQLAWWLDQVERIKRPLLQVVSRASQTLEHLEPEPIQAEELTLRLAEIEPQLHHTLRRFNYWRDQLAKDKRLRAAVEPLRMLAGLPGE